MKRIHINVVFRLADAFLLLPFSEISPGCLEKDVFSHVMQVMSKY